MSTEGGGMVFNTEKTKVMLIKTWQKRLHIDENHLTLSYDTIELQITTCDKILGVYIDENWQWNNNYQVVCKKYLLISGYCLEYVSFLSHEHRRMYYKYKLFKKAGRRLALYLYEPSSFW